MFSYDENKYCKVVSSIQITNTHCYFKNVQNNLMLSDL